MLEMKEGEMFPPHHGEQEIEPVTPPLPVVPEEVHFSDVQRKISLRHPKATTDPMLAQAIEWESYHMEKVLMPEWKRKHLRWQSEEPIDYLFEDSLEFEMAHRQWSEKELSQPQLDVEGRQACYSLEHAPVPLYHVTDGTFVDTHDDELFITTRTYNSTPPPFEDLMEPAKLERDVFINSDILVHGVLWQVNKAGRENLNEAINYGTRKKLSAATSQHWILSDNSLRETTFKELKEVMNAYTERMQQTFTQYSLWRAAGVSEPFTAK